MKYFLTEDERKLTNSTCYHEFFRGKWNDKTCKFWNQDSINIHDDVMYNLKFDTLIMRVIKDYDPFGETIITQEQWTMMCEKAETIGGELVEAILEITPWIEETFNKHRVFTILGI